MGGLEAHGRGSKRCWDPSKQVPSDASLPLAQLRSCPCSLPPSQAKMAATLPTHEQNPSARVAGGQAPGMTCSHSISSRAAPGPQQKCQLGGHVLLEMSGPCSKVSARRHPSQPALGSPCWPMALRARVAPSTLAGWDWPRWKAAEVGGGVSPGVDEVLRKADVCRGSCDGNLALR